MTKLMPYIILLLLGFICGLISMYYMVRNRIENKRVYVGKAKQKGGVGNDQDFDLDLSDANSVKTKRELRRERRNQRRLDKQSTNN